MRNGTQNCPSIRFGSFEVDLAAHELRKRGVRIRVQEQPFRVLAMLLARPGQVVTREELQQELWPDEEYGDFDLGLNTAVKKLRRALGDSANSPKWIETIPKVGYRFLGGVDYLSGDLPAAASASCAERRQLVLAAAAVLLVGAASFSGWRLGRDERPAQAPTEFPATTLPGAEYSPALSADGRRLAFEVEGDVYLQTVGEPEPLPLTAGPDLEGRPAWAPDGRTIAFAMRRELDLSYWTVPATGGRPVKLTDSRAAVAREGAVVGSARLLAWMPDGKSFLVVDRDSREGPNRIFSFDPSSGAKEPLTAPPEEILGDLAPAISPDGTKLAFLRRHATLISKILVVELPSGQPPKAKSSRVAFEAVNLRDLDWTPTGEALIVSTQREIWLVPLGNSGPARKLSNHGGNFSRSADGDRLAIVEEVRDSDIWRIGGPAAVREQASSGEVPVTDSSRHDGQPRLSPDGSRLAFISDRIPGREIWVSDADGANASPLTSLGSSFHGNPAWSPDGRTIAFWADVTGQQDIYLVDAEGGAPEQFTHDPAADVHPAFSPDGRWIYFGSERSGDSQIWRKPPGGGKAEQITFDGSRRGRS